VTRVVIAADALERLAADPPRRALVVADATTFEVLGAEVARALGGAETLVFERRCGLEPGREEVARVLERLRPGTTPLAVGAGVITDIVRCAAHRAGLDFVSVPTAASMDGYASGVAALVHDGVKVTLPARPPSAIFADPRVAVAAPAELTRAGLGDLLGKATARVDWLAAHLLYGEPFCPEAADLVLEALSSAAGGAEAALAGDAAAVRRLLEGLVKSGIAMALAGSSRPASGFEHHASHFWDLLAVRGMRPHHRHGLQVGYATRLAIALQRFAFAGGVESLRPPRPPRDPLGPSARRWLGEPTPEIAAAVQEKRRFAARLADWPADQRAWERVRTALAPEVERFERVLEALHRAAIPAAPAELDLDQEMLRATLRHATRLRARYTVVDLLEGQGMLEAAIDAVLG